MQRYCFYSKQQPLIKKKSLNLHMILMKMDEQGLPKAIMIPLFQVAMTLGTYLGGYILLAYIATALSVKYSAFSFIAMPLFLCIPVVAFILVKRYRDQNCKPFFPFPISWMISILMFLFATVLSCMMVYLYLRFIDHGALAAGIMARMELLMQSSDQEIAKLTDPAQIEQMKSVMDLMRQSITWFCSLPASGVTKQLIQSSLFWGNILSLIIALFTAKRLRSK